ncbi:hypothetical protein FHR24_000162 [Wenyingzhuangia heitensis]|uniref:Outer membrane protein beta-barrel domain-containing protein n=1 Tax=Wenyingzhuangia heitensis TaxID=1487859 RepID=A0ABX0U4C7_9FLAO|nr:hypothetical protein [Wenyingzhuangia heitensis]NIJ43723.1 hypothetical protein [Wenyingzhuangia heitensis]
MKNLKITGLFLLLLSLVTVNANAQDEDNKWAVGFGVNVVDISSASLSNIGDQVTDYVGVGDWNSLASLSRISLARYIDKGLTVDGAVAINTISKTPSGDYDDLAYYSVDFGARYDLNELVGDTAWFDPYVKFSVGGAWLDSESLGLVLSPTLGFNTWFNDNVGLNVESAYKTSTLGNDDSLVTSGYHFQHSISFILRFDE